VTDSSGAGGTPTGREQGSLLLGQRVAVSQPPQAEIRRLGCNGLPRQRLERRPGPLPEDAVLVGHELHEQAGQDGAALRDEVRPRPRGEGAQGAADGHRILLLLEQPDQEVHGAGIVVVPQLEGRHGAQDGVLLR